MLRPGAFCLLLNLPKKGEVVMPGSVEQGRSNPKGTKAAKQSDRTLIFHSHAFSKMNNARPIMNPVRRNDLRKLER